MDLINKRILITRPRAQAAAFAELLSAHGAASVYFPVIEISPLEDTEVLDRALRRLASYQWLVLTSVNGVEQVWRRLERQGIHTLPEGLKVAAIGPKTAGALEKVGVRPDFVPEEYVAEAILPGLGELNGRWVLLLRADIARAALPEAIQCAGGIAHEIAVYTTLPASPDPDALRELEQGVDVVTFTSSSTVLNFMEMVRAAGLDPLALPGSPIFACIGPVTASTAREMGIPVAVVAGEYTTSGLVDSLLEYRNGKMD